MPRQRFQKDLGVGVGGLSSARDLSTVVVELMG